MARTQEKPASLRSLTETQKKDFGDWLSTNDKSFFVSKMLVSAARTSAPHIVTAKLFKELRLQFCKYWKSPNIKRRVPSQAICLDDHGWESICEATRKNSGVLMEDDSTLDFCVLYLRSLGVVCSRRLLLNSSAFHRLTKNRYRPVEEMKS